jgi:hypothetical protein
MAYIGSIPAYQASGVRPRDEFTADGTQICFPLSQSVPGSFESGVTIILDNVPQQPVEAFTVVDTRTLTLTSISGTFTVNETVTGGTSAATGTVLKVNLNNIVIRGLTGTFNSSETITGGSSSATATTTSVTINTGSGILFSEAPTAASIIYVVHEGNATYNLVPTAASVGPSQLADNLRNFTVDTFTGDGTTTAFTLSDTPSSANSLLVMVDGIVQTKTTNYTLSGAVVTFTDAPDSSAAITIIHLGFSTISRTGLVDGSVTTAKIADNAITSAKLGFDVIVAEDIAANAITVAEIASGAVTTAKLATDLVVTHSLGSASTPSITFTGDTNTGIFSPTADTIAFAEGGAEIARFDSSGNLGIDTTSPAYRLHVRRAGGVASLGINLDNTVGFTRDVQYYSVADSTSDTTGHAFYVRNGSATNNLALRISNAGTLTLQGGSTSATGVGISFPATQVASSDANTLDDYEEGTFTPTWTGVSSGSVTTGQLLGKYTKVGNIVTVWISAVNPSATTLSGDWKFSLPFAISGFSAYFTGNVGYTRYIPAIAGYGQNIVWGSNGYNYIYMGRNSTTTGETANQSGNVSADCLLGITFTYPAST